VEYDIVHSHTRVEHETSPKIPKGRGQYQSVPCQAEKLKKKFRFHKEVRRKGTAHKSPWEEGQGTEEGRFLQLKTQENRLGAHKKVTSGGEKTSQMRHSFKLIPTKQKEKKGE